MKRKEEEDAERAADQKRERALADAAIATSARKHTEEQFAEKTARQLADLRRANDELMRKNAKVGRGGCGAGCFKNTFSWLHIWLMVSGPFAAGIF
jgi:hypothetical protein